MTSFQETQGASLNESYHGSKDLKVGKQTPENKNSPLLLPPNPSKTVWRDFSEEAHKTKRLK